MDALEDRLSLPDVADNFVPAAYGTLDKVGMQNIEIPLNIAGPDGRIVTVPAHADLFVNLNDPKQKGIHMSRLLLLLQEHLETRALSAKVLRELLHAMAQSHSAMSSRAFLSLKYDYLCKRPSLLSENRGWRAYPVTIAANLINRQLSLQLKARVTYSSTCPCSASLARQLIQRHFEKEFAGRKDIGVAEMSEWLGREESIIATPHAQRSIADITVEFCDENPVLDPLRLIDMAEDALQTPVQAAVKREDEQEFARLNASNYMFCEDAARKIKAAIGQWKGLTDYHIQVEHQESLHPHDAVAVAVKGVPGGFQA